MLIRSFFGRVSRRLDEDHVEVICCGLHITRVLDDEVEYHPEYKGYLDSRTDLRRRYPVFVRMPSLRKLKKRASYYNDHVWARKRGDIDIHADDYWDLHYAGGVKDRLYVFD